MGNWVTGTALPPDALAFTVERHLATLTTIRADGSPHVAPVGFTFEPETETARIITWAGAQKARLLSEGGRVAVCQVDGARWMTLEGHARVTTDVKAIEQAVERYATRYRQPKERSDRVAIEISVDRIMGSVLR